SAGDKKKKRRQTRKSYDVAKSKRQKKRDDLPDTSDWSVKISFSSDTDTDSEEQLETKVAEYEEVERLLITKRAFESVEPLGKLHTLTLG
ncbi:hypothetical protein MMC11_003354, partial [Xylographa trunciseda]|nr:hypothetical protein [Xylographa trunciseda]